MKDLRLSTPRTRLLDSQGFVAREWVQFFNDLAGQLAQAAPLLTGFEPPTGPTSKATFDTATVTLPELAERVAAIIDATGD